MMPSALPRACPRVRRAARRAVACAAVAVAALWAAAPLVAQSADALAARLAAMTAVTGYEDAVVDSILALVPGARLDRAGNVVWHRGSGEPVRVAACPLDEVGYVVGAVTAEGYLTLRRVGATPVGPLFDQYLEGQRVTVWGRRGPVAGVVGVRSTHLQRGRGAGTDDPFALDNAFVDVGAMSAADAASLGIAPLDPVARTKRPHRYGDGLLAAPFAAQRAACAALVAAVSRLPAGEGTAVAVFARRRHFGNDGAGLAVLEAARGLPADRVVLVGGAPAAPDSLGAGTVAVVRDSVPVAMAMQPVTAWNLPTRYGRSPVETVALRDVDALAARLAGFLAGAPRADAGRSDAPAATIERDEAPLTHPPFAGVSIATAAGLREAEDVLRRLAETYAVSGHEAAVRDAVIRLLPPWTSPTVDSAGNVVVRLGHGDPVDVFVAHLDELGFEITAVRDDGRLELRPRGGFYASLFEAEPALVHTAAGPVPGVFAPRDSVGPAPRRSPPPLRLDVGTRTGAATEALGIRVGDAVTMVKQYVPLAGARATARSFDDRAGCAAQILALRHLDPRTLRHAAVFVWSVREETGLQGARVAAERLWPEHPVRVYAIDTFVSSDTPLDPKAFAEARLGRGPVARAVDNSAVTPPALRDSLVALARGRRLPLQVGTTNGGNDGSAFTRYGVADVPIGWPGRYSHSPVEVLDLRDLVALADLIQTIVERW